MKNEVFNVGVDLGNGFTNYLSQRNNNEGQRFMTRIEVMTNNAFKNQKNEIPVPTLYFLPPISTLWISFF